MNVKPPSKLKTRSYDRTGHQEFASDAFDFYARLMKQISLFIASFLLASCQTISKGQVGPDYKVLAVSYIDTSGLYWLETLDKEAKNGCIDKFENYKTSACSKTILTGDDSEAEKKCESFGARLPTMGEYERLLKDFEPKKGLEKGLSSETYHQVAMAFKDDMPWAAWTSTIRSDDQTQAHFFSWSRGSLQNRIDYRSVDLPVRCVRKPQLKE
jgi:hypothetical protein